MEERDTQLSQAYRDAPHPEPSPALDARILDAARQAVAKPTGRRRSPWFTWAVPLSTAAVVVLGVTLLFEMQRQAPEVLQSPTAMPPAIEMDMTPPVQEASPAEPKVSTAVEEPVTPELARGQSRHAAAPAESTSSAADMTRDERDVAIHEAPPPQPFPAQQATAPVPPPPPPPALPAPEVRSLAKPAPKAAQEMANSAGAPASLAEHAADAMRAPSSPAMAPALGRAPENAGAARIIETPERMVEAIRNFIREGRLDEARKALETLRRTHPGFEVPDELTQQLTQ